MKIPKGYRSDNVITETTHPIFNMWANRHHHNRDLYELRQDLDPHGIATAIIVFVLAFLFYTVAAFAVSELARLYRRQTVDA